jgi:hypothetical protein
MSASNISAFNLQSFLKKEMLNGANFMDWYLNLRIVLSQEKTEYVLIELYPDDLPAGLTAANHRAHEKRYDDALNISCLMLAIMSSNLGCVHYDSGYTWDI